MAVQFGIKAVRSAPFLEPAGKLSPAIPDEGLHGFPVSRADGVEHKAWMRKAEQRHE